MQSASSRHPQSTLQHLWQSYTSDRKRFLAHAIGILRRDLFNLEFTYNALVLPPSVRAPLREAEDSLIRVIELWDNDFGADRYEIADEAVLLHIDALLAAHKAVAGDAICTARDLLESMASKSVSQDMLDTHRAARIAYESGLHALAAAEWDQARMAFESATFLVNEITRPPPRRSWSKKLSKAFSSFLRSLFSLNVL